MKAKLFVGSLLLAASTALFAQSPAQPGQSPGGRDRMMQPCSKEPDPAKCEARRKEIHEHMKSARDACNSKQGRERGTCIAQQMCANAPNPAACQSRAKERMERREERREKGDRPKV